MKGWIALLLIASSLAAGDFFTAFATFVLYILWVGI